jgi:polar amino acid transport system substrate-binding protein
MARLSMIVWVLVVGVFMACHAEAEDRVASIGESPFSAQVDATGVHGRQVEIVRALDRATHSSTKIIVQPFARSLKETATGHADFHIPLIQNGNSSAPEGLVYVTEVNFGHIPFVIYSRKVAPLDAKTVAGAKNIEIEPGHESFFPFPVKVTHCVPCSLDKVLLGRADALIVAADIVDPLLAQPKYKGIHRALFKMYPVRALVPANADSTATRRYLIEGAKRIQETGEMWKILGHDMSTPYTDWQP